jgi:cystathionine beta-synthase
MEPRPLVADTVLDLIGGTPLVPLHRIGKGLDYQVYAKLEFLNPGGSIKDRIGPLMIEQAEKEGWLRPGGTIIEATSGNTGVGLAMVAAVKGYRLIIVIPDKMSTEKIRLLKAFGAKVVITPAQVPPEHPMSNISVAKRLSVEIPNSYYPNQYENQMNPEAHYRTTGPEIFEALHGEVDAVVMGIGTTGTASGVGRFFKEKRPQTKIVGVDPRGSILAHFAKTGEKVAAVPYKVEGIGEDMIPKTAHFKFIDDFITVDDRESFAMARRLVKEEGLFVGGSSGTAVAGALKWADAAHLPHGAKIVVILPDSGDRYLSKLYSDDWMRENGFIDETMKVGDVLGAKDFQPPVVSVPTSTTVHDALSTMKQHGISQLPVLSGESVVGSLLEDEILKEVMRDATAMGRTVAQVMGPPFPEIGRGEPLNALMEKLKEERAVMVRGSAGEGVVGFLTRFDLVTFLSSENDNAL